VSEPIFIAVTDEYDRKVRVNVANIVCYQNLLLGGDTQLVLSNYSVVCKETPEKIEQMLNFRGVPTYDVTGLGRPEKEAE
jgi:hypothetical protein